MLYSTAGLLLSLGVAAAAWRRSRTRGGYYDGEVYGLNRMSHIRYAVVSLAFAAVFAATAWLRLDAAGIAALALYALLAVFYVTSFLQGAADSDE